MRSNWDKGFSIGQDFPNPEMGIEKKAMAQSICLPGNFEFEN